MDKQAAGENSSALRRFCVDRRGNISVVMTLTLIPVIAAIGMGAEASNWFLTQRAIQNAADAAVLAAVMNGCNPADACHTSALQPSYDQEAKSVAAKYGFPDGGDTTVTPSDAAPCPGGGGACYSVTITRKVPFYLLRVIGFDGDTTTTAGLKAQTVSAVAVAAKLPGSQYCVTALSNNQEAIRVNGGPDVHFENCDAFTPNGGARCNGISNGGAFRSAYMSNPPHANACPSPSNQADPFVDNFADKPIPSDPCGGSYPQASNKGDVAPANLITSEADLATAKCGDVKLANNITISSDKTLYIYNGRLDLAGKTLSTSGDGGLAIVFTGTNTSSGGTTYTHSFMSSVNSTESVIDIAAPTSGPWSGVAVYQDPKLTGSKNALNFEASGNKLTMNISGLFYAKNAEITLKGNVTYASTGSKCLAMIVNKLLMSGSINASTSECEDQGLSGLPQVYNLANLVR